jgi:hypothetical protein
MKINPVVLNSYRRAGLHPKVSYNPAMAQQLPPKEQSQSIRSKTFAQKTSA